MAVPRRSARGGDTKFLDDDPTYVTMAPLPHRAPLRTSLATPSPAPTVPIALAMGTVGALSGIGAALLATAEPLPDALGNPCSPACWLLPAGCGSAPDWWP